MKNFIALTMLFVCITSIVVPAKELVLQNGLNGYIGCEDSYDDLTVPDLNFGDAETLPVYNSL